MPKTLTITFNACEPSPENGYRVFYRIVGSLGPYIDAGLFETSPIEIFVEDAEGEDQFEGYIFSDCNGTFGNQIPFLTTDEGGGGEPEPCVTEGIGAWVGTFSLVVDEGGSRTLSGLLNCAIGCPCELVTGTNVARYSPSSPCLGDCNLIDTSGLWRLGSTGYLTYIGPGEIILCDGLDLNLLFEASNCCEILEIQAGEGGCTLNWEDCESGSPLSEFVAEGNQLARCGRPGGFSVDGDYTVVASGEPC